MGVTVIPGWGSELGATLKSGIEAVKNIADPNFTFKRQLERELVTNPELVQHLSDLEYSNPGSVTHNFGHLLTPGAQSAIQGAPPSLNARINRIIQQNPSEVTPDMVHDMVSHALTGERAGEAAIGRAKEQSIQEFMAASTPEQRQAVGQTELAPQLTTADARIAAARIRAQYATTPDERIANLKEMAQYRNNLEVQRDLFMLNQQERVRATRERPTYINSIAARWRQIQSAMTRYGAKNVSDTERQGLTAGINSNIEMINALRSNLDEAPLAFTVGEQQSSPLGFDALGSRSIHFMNAQGQPINDVTDQLVVPSMNPTSGGTNVTPSSPSSSSGGSSVGNRSGGNTVFTPERSRIIDVAVSGAHSPHDINASKLLTPQEKTEAYRRYGASHPPNRR